MDRSAFFIGGEWVEAHSSKRLRLVNPTTERQYGTVPIADSVDVYAAVAAAGTAFPGWSRTSQAERSEHIASIVHALDAKSEELAQTITQEIGCPISLSRTAQVGSCSAVFSTYVDIARNFSFERSMEAALVVQEAAGVAVAITAWNYPLLLMAAKIAPALAAGCTTVLKPSELTSLSSLLFAEVLENAGLPPGVVNVITGDGPVTGEHLIRHPDVAAVSFTGSTKTGRHIAQAAAETIKNVTLELGGKSASLVFADADLETAVRSTVASAFRNSGQTCVALTRLVIERSRQEEALEIAREAAREWTLGDPMSEDTRVGPVASASQYDLVQSMIHNGIRDGARVIVGGTGKPAGFDRGYYVQPTILADIDPCATVAQEEIFGPVLSVIPFDNDDHAIEIANNSRYGLSGGVWSGDEQRAMRIARRVQTGMISINAPKGSLLVPFGGVKQSGQGREWGETGMYEYLETKSILL